MTELEAYLQDPDYETTALEYWKSKVDLYPTLARLSNPHLVMLGTSASAERMFSQAGNIEKRKRYHMVEDTMQGYILCKKGYISKLLH